MSSGAIAILILVAGVVSLGLLLRRFVRWVGFPCKFCSSRLTAFDELPPSDQENILAYFREHELRDPDTNAVFACRSCRVIFDDLSGTKESGDRDVPTSGIFCKVCSAFMYPCPAGVDVITCSSCGATHEWKDYRNSGFRFFTPPAGVELKALSTDKEDLFRRSTESCVSHGESVRNI